MEKKTYVSPKLEIILFEEQDIILSSGDCLFGYDDKYDDVDFWGQN